MQNYQWQDWGLIDYEEARIRQLELFNNNIQLKLQGKSIQNQLIVCEHPPVITLGKSANSQNLLFNKEWLNRKGVALHETERGGDITFHGPGQLVVYPHFDIETLGMGVKAYIEAIEEVILQTVARFGIKAERFSGYTGVWLDQEGQHPRKIAAIGVKCSRGVTMHGLALNVNTDLTYFDLIVPCGIEGKSVTSLEKETKSAISMSEVKQTCKVAFERVFKIELKQ